MNMSIPKPDSTKPIAPTVTPSNKCVSQSGSFRPVQPKDLEAKRRKAYPYLF